MIIFDNFKDCMDFLPKTLAEGIECIGFIVGERTEVHYGLANDADLEYCEAHGIPCYNLRQPGGTVVSAAGNISIGFLYNNHDRGGLVLSPILSDLMRYLSKRDLSATVNKNDLLVDGYKVAAGSARNFGEKHDWTYEVFYISINQDLETIKNVCKKPMVKVPKGLSEYGITTEEMVEWCSNWLKEHLDIDVLP